MSDPLPPVPPLPPGPPSGGWYAPAGNPPPPVPPHPTDPYFGGPYAGAPYAGGASSAADPRYASPPYAAAPTLPYAAPYAAPGNPRYADGLPYAGTAPAAAAHRGLGAVALVLAAVALVATPVAAGLAAFQIGAGIAEEFAALSPGQWEDLSFLTPVRDWVLLLEVAFWSGTVLGMWAIVQGVVAIVKARGRGLAIGATIVAVVAPIVFSVIAYVCAIAGVGIGSATAL